MVYKQQTYKSWEARKTGKEFKEDLQALRAQITELEQMENSEGLTADQRLKLDTLREQLNFYKTK